MTTKILEIRDNFTRILAVAIQAKGDTPAEKQALRACGYPEDGSSIILMDLNNNKASNDPYDPIWGANRTMRMALDYVIQHWDQINDGDLIDVEFLNGTRAEPKTPEVLKK